MSRIYENDGSFFFAIDDEEFEVQLNENNLIGHSHRDAPLYDRIAIEDPRDKDYWTWFRYNQDPDVFNYLMKIACDIGTVLLRSTPLTDVEASFDARFRLQDEDFDKLLEGENDGTN